MNGICDLSWCDAKASSDKAFCGDHYSIYIECYYISVSVNKIRERHGKNDVIKAFHDDMGSDYPYTLNYA